MYDDAGAMVILRGHKLTEVQIGSQNFLDKARLAKSSRLATGNGTSLSLSKSSVQCKNTVMPLVSNYEFSPRSRQTTRRTATSAYTFVTASTTVATSASSWTSIASAFLISSRGTATCHFQTATYRTLRGSSSLASRVSGARLAVWRDLSVLTY
jgi:hypothetical protein